MWLLLLPTLAYALTAAEVLEVSKEAVSLCGVAESVRTELGRTDPQCIWTTTCRDAVREAYAPLFNACPDVIRKLQEIAASAGCPKKEEHSCRLDRKAMRSLGEQAAAFRKALDRSLEGERIDRGCEEYDKAFRRDEYGTCPKKAEVAKVRDLQRKLLAEAALPLEKLLKDFAEGKKN